MSIIYSPNHSELREPRIGLMAHYSAGSFESTVAWCRTPRSGVSYTDVIRWDGHIEPIVPRDRRSWHAGVCRPSSDRLCYVDANSAFEGVALAGGPAFGPPTKQAIAALVAHFRARMEAHGWPLAETWRITDHAREAWPRGRKSDVMGDSHGYGPVHPWLDLDAIRQEVARVG